MCVSHLSSFHCYDSGTTIFQSRCHLLLLSEGTIISPSTTHSKGPQWIDMPKGRGIHSMSIRCWEPSFMSLQDTIKTTLIVAAKYHPKRKHITVHPHPSYSLIWHHVISGYSPKSKRPWMVNVLNWFRTLRQPLHHSYDTRERALPELLQKKPRMTG